MSIRRLLAMMSLATRDWDGALASVERCFDCDPHAPQLFFLEARIHLKRGDYESAFTSLKTCLAVKPNYVPAIRCLARIYEATNDLNRSLKLWQRLLSLRPFDRESDQAVRAIMVRQNLVDQRRIDVVRDQIEQLI
jgi:tetratricopeptide (TPR) repeat protein